MKVQSRSGRGKSVIGNLQALRAVSALLVIFFHLDRLLGLLGLPRFGSGGVDIFFVISGFIMVYTTADRHVSPRSFLADRFARVVPPYWAMTLAVFAIALVAPTLLQSTQASWTELAKSLAFVPFAKSNGFIEPILFVGWSLNYEMFFYLLFTLGLAAPARRAGCIGVIALIVALVMLGLLLRPHGIAAQFYTRPAMLDFVLGMIIGLAYPQLPDQARLPVRLATTLLVGTSLVAIVVLPALFPDRPTFPLCGLPAGLVVLGALLLERWGWAIRSGPLLRLGAASYSIYLVHPFVTQIAQKVTALLPVGAAGALLALALTLAAACLAGMLVHRTIERPLSGAARRLFATPRLNPRVS